MLYYLSLIDCHAEVYDKSNRLGETVELLKRQGFAVTTKKQGTQVGLVLVIANNIDLPSLVTQHITHRSAMMVSSCLFLSL